MQNMEWFIGIAYIAIIIVLFLKSSKLKETITYPHEGDRYYVEGDIVRLYPVDNYQAINASNEEYLIPTENRESELTTEIGSGEPGANENQATDTSKEESLIPTENGVPEVAPETSPEEPIDKPSEDETESQDAVSTDDSIATPGAHREISLVDYNRAKKQKQVQ